MSRLSPSIARSRGFTLVEVLVCLFVVGLIASMLLSVLDMQWRRTLMMGLRSKGDETVIAAQTTLRGRLEAMRVVPDLRTGGTRLVMGGTGREVAFQAPLSASGGPHALHGFRLLVDKDKALMLYRINLRGKADPFGTTLAGWDGLRLLDNVERIEITYFGRERITGRDAWQERWEAQAELPKLIRIKLTFAAGDSRFWPVMMVKPSPQLRLGCTGNGQDANC
jgi:general secretion pathway protein J